MTANQISGCVDILSSLLMFYYTRFYSDTKYNYKIIGKFTLITMIKITWPFVLGMGLLKYFGIMPG